MRIRWTTIVLLVGIAAWSQAASAAEIAGRWIAEVSSKTLLEPAYAHVTLEGTGDTVTGTWGNDSIKGSVKGSQIKLTLTDAQGTQTGDLTGTLGNNEFTGSGTLTGLGRRPGGAGAAGRPPMPQEVSWKLTKERLPPSHARSTTNQRPFRPTTTPAINLTFTSSPATSFTPGPPTQAAQTKIFSE
jgi:amidase